MVSRRRVVQGVQAGIIVTAAFLAEAVVSDLAGSELVGPFAAGVLVFGLVASLGGPPASR